MSPGRSAPRTTSHPDKGTTRKKWRLALAIGLGVGLLSLGALAALSYESYHSVYEASYVGSTRCGECHEQVHAQWANSPHALMVRTPTQQSVVGDFADNLWSIPSEATSIAAVRMRREKQAYYMDLLRPGGDDYQAFKIDYVVGYKYRQTYLHAEPDGVLRRLPLQWSVERGEFFPYWNFQEGSQVSVEDLWAQMRTQNSAWNLFCARCHVTHLDIRSKSFDHRSADVNWAEDGISCEACHGPGSQHAAYFASNYVNRLAAFANSKLRGEPVAYIATAPKMDTGRALSTCAQCHGADIMLASTEAYRQYEPGYGGPESTTINDLSQHFKEYPLQPGRTDPTVECWADGRPKGIGMLFRSFVESACYEGGQARCYDCHDPHANDQPSRPGMLSASAASDAYCLGCHSHLKDHLAEHTHHTPGTPGSFCFDCHMPHSIQNVVGGFERMVRTHQMSGIPDPGLSIEHGLDAAPNACNECHSDRTPQWAVRWIGQWWP